jgi:hypothetical protein
MLANIPNFQSTSPFARARIFFGSGIRIQKPKAGSISTRFVLFEANQKFSTMPSTAKPIDAMVASAEKKIFTSDLRFRSIFS